ncbi:MAG: sulfotransferase [Caulobacterales bacterium]
MKRPPRTLKTVRRPRGVGGALAPAALNGQLDIAAAHYAAGRLAEAAGAYGRIERQAPDDIRAPYSLAVIDIRRGRLESARRRLKLVTRRDPTLFPAQHNLGSVCQALGHWREAAEAFAQAVAVRPDAVELRFNLATALAILGRTDEAVACYRALAEDPTTRHRALTRLAILSPDGVEAGELAELQRAAWDPAVDQATRTGLLFALGDVLERRHAEGAAFDAYAEGNRLQREALSASPASDPVAVARANAAAIQSLIGIFTPQFVAQHQGRGHPTADPVFIVGMPRSGSTLVEQILASHRDVQALGETGVLTDLLNGRFPYADVAPEGPAPFRRLAELYLGAMRARGWKPGARLVDKTLENYLHVGMIALMFPRAVILHTVRDPVDTCLACYRQLFASGNETLYDLAEIGAEFVRYRRIMQHWATVLPGRVAEVSYEALVADPQVQIRRLVTQACGLAWDPACLDFHKAGRSVRTASAAQVRQPIFTTSVQRWRRYADRLGPLLESLGPYAPES